MVTRPMKSTMMRVFTTTRRLFKVSLPLTCCEN
jgi:hypothetical protein